MITNSPVSPFKSPAIAMIVVGTILSIIAVYCIAMTSAWVDLVTEKYDPSVSWEQENINEGARRFGLEVPKRNTLAEERAKTLSVLYAYFLGVLTIGVLIISGSISMLKARRYGMAITSAILTIIFGVFLYLLPVPIGIWALVVLLKPANKLVFKETGRQDIEGVR